MVVKHSTSQWWIQDFPNGGRGHQPWFCTTFAKNCMKMKTVDRGEGKSITHPLLPPPRIRQCFISTGFVSKIESTECPWNLQLLSRRHTDLHGLSSELQPTALTHHLASQTGVGHVIIQTDSRQLGVAVVGAGDGVVLARVEVTLKPRKQKKKENVRIESSGWSTQRWLSGSHTTTLSF